MRKHPGIPAERSNSNAFWSDENLNLRAQEASYSDFAPLPGEVVGDALAASGSLQAHLAAGGALTPLSLSEVEVDDGGRSADVADDFLDPSSYVAPTAMPEGDSLDRLADLLVERITKRLGGN